MWGLDERSMAAFRVALAVLLLNDLYVRSASLDAFYTDGGLVPASYATAQLSPWGFSLHLAAASAPLQACIFLLAAWFGLQLLVGHRTRRAQFACWFLNVSLQARNRLVLNGGDNLLAGILFFSLGLPLGACFSLDAVRAPPAPDKRRTPLLNASALAMHAQMAVMYAFAVVLKTGTSWRDGSALYYALSLGGFATPLAAWLLLLPPPLLRTAAHAALVTEAALVVLPLLPFFPGPARLLYCSLVVAMHVSFGSCLEIGVFMWAPCCVALLFLPPLFWDALVPRMQLQPCTRLEVEVRAGHSHARALVRAALVAAAVPHAAHRLSDAAHGALEGRWWAVTARGPWAAAWLTSATASAQPLTGAAAVVALCAASPLLWPLALLWRIPGAPAVLRLLYACVAAIYCAFCPSPVPPRPLRRREREEKSTAAAAVAKAATLALQLFILVVAVTVVWGNCASSNYARRPPAHLRAVTGAFQLEQYWALFAPSPAQNDGWPVFAAMLADGTEVEILQGGEVTYERPKCVACAYLSQRWRKYLMNLRKPRHAGLREGLATYFCRKWNEVHVGDEWAEEVRVYYVRQENLSDFRRFEPLAEEWAVATCPAS